MPCISLHLDPRLVDLHLACGRKKNRTRKVAQRLCMKISGPCRDLTSGLDSGSMSTVQLLRCESRGGHVQAIQPLKQDGKISKSGLVQDCDSSPPTESLKAAVSGTRQAHRRSVAGIDKCAWIATYADLGNSCHCKIYISRG